MITIRWQILILLFAMGLSSAQISNQEKEGQTKPDVNGTWKLDPTKSNAVDIGKPGEPIKIVYSDPELRITRTFVVGGQSVEHDFVYLTNGKGEKNPGTLFVEVDSRSKRPTVLQNEQVKSKTKWQGNKIVTRSSVESRIGGVGGLSMQYLVVDEWKMSPDSKTLTQTTKFQADPDTIPSFEPTSTPDQKRVYVLISK
jgi:hypothetical protein